MLSKLICTVHDQNEAWKRLKSARPQLSTVKCRSFSAFCQSFRHLRWWPVAVDLCTKTKGDTIKIVIRGNGKKWPKIDRNGIRSQLPSFKQEQKPSSQGLTWPPHQTLCPTHPVSPATIILAARQRLAARRARSAECVRSSSSMQ